MLKNKFQNYHYFEISRAYSSGDCFGFSPNSLLRFVENKLQITKTATKVSN